MASNLLSNIGLVSQGVRAAEIDAAALAQQKQATRRGELGLADLERGAQEQEAMRGAVRSSQSVHDMLMAQADAAQQSGDSEGFQKYATEAMQMPQRNAYMMAEAALSGASAEQLEAIDERNMGANRDFDKGTLRISKDPTTGHVIVNATKQGQPLPSIDVTDYYAKRQKPMAVGKGQAIINPVTKEVIYSNAEQPEAGASDGSTYWKTGPNAGQIISKAKPRTTVSITKTEGGAQAQKDLPMFNAIAKQIAGYPDMGTLDQFGNATLSEEGNRRASIANQIAQTNRNLDPATIARITIKGRPVVDQKTGEKAIEYKGKYYRYAEGVQAQPQQNVRETTTTRGAVANFACGGKVDHKGIR